MKLQTITLSVVAVLATATGALADSYSTNTYINGTETGHKTIDVVNTRYENGHISEFSSSLKLNTDFPNAVGYIKFDGDLSARLDVSTDGIDPSVVGGYSEQISDYSFTDETIVNITESVDYFNDIYTHTLEVGNN